MTGIGNFLYAAFKEYCPQVVLNDYFVQDATADIEKHLLDKGVDTEVFKRCIVWHFKNNKEFANTLFGKSKDQTKPHWALIREWNGLHSTYARETQRRIVNEDNTPTPYRPATRHVCLQFIAEAHKFGMPFMTDYFKTFYKEAGFSDEEIRELEKFDHKTPKSEMAKMLNNLAKAQHHDKNT